MKSLICKIKDSKYMPGCTVTKRGYDKVFLLDHNGRLGNQIIFAHVYPLGEGPLGVKGVQKHLSSSVFTTRPSLWRLRG